MKVLIGISVILLSLSLSANDKRAEKIVPKEMKNTKMVEKENKDKNGKDINRKPASTETDYIYSPEFPSFMGF